MNLAVTETYDADALDNLLLSPYQLGGEIFSQDDWISCIVNTSKRPDNYIKQIEKLEAIKKKFEVEDPIKLLAHWYFHRKISIHHIATHFLDGIYKEKALYVFLSKQLGWNMRLHTDITENGKNTLGLVASIRDRTGGVFQIGK